MRPTVVCLRSGGRRPVRLWDSMDCRDPQQEFPASWCPGCGREIYEWGQQTCPECKGESHEEYEGKSLFDLQPGALGWGLRE